MKIDEQDYIAHYGILRKSGRYPWGSGGPEYVYENKRNQTWIDHIKHLKSEGLTDREIAKGMGISVSALRAANSIARNEARAANISTAQRLHDKGMSNSAIGRQMGKNESTIRAYLEPGAKDKADILISTSNMLRNEVDSKGFIDIGKGVENYVGVSATRLDAAVSILREEGYEVHRYTTPQLGTGHETNRKVLGPPGSTQKEAWLNRDNLNQIGLVSSNNGRTYPNHTEPIRLNPKRVGVIYGPDGGAKADGVIYVRPGVRDVSLGGAKYAQVRIAVGNGHYLKGMAMYKDDLPPGVDVMFNTNKADTGNKFDAMKEVTGDKDNPFGALVRPLVDNPETPKEKVYSSMNIVNEEGDWANWSNSLSSQILSKQSPALARTQLNMTYDRRQKEHKSINSLTNPVVRKKLLEDFADSTDTASVHLQAAALPHQGQHVILPIASMPRNEIYAPNYVNGDKVVLIRHPHGGTFEIPELIVNNHQAEAKRLLRNAKDAVGIHHSVAERLSGADFDGDFVLVIPNNQNKFLITPALEGLKDFDPRSTYPKYDGMKVMKNTQTEMGKISNLITDMSLQDASHEELARAVRHSMVVIDAAKHELNYKQSYLDNNIKQLRGKYQPSGGAATLISRARSRKDVPERKPRTSREGGPIDTATGEKVYVPRNRISSITGKPRTTRTTKLKEARDAHTLSSGTPMETLYANHSNRLKALANQARLDTLKVPSLIQSPSAKKAYSNEVASLNSQLALAKRNAPLERQAQTIANTEYKTKVDADPLMDKTTKKKVKYQALEKARIRTGASKHKITISDREWDAIQAGAISNSKLSEILTHADMDVVRDLATPKTTKLMSSSESKRASTMLNSGYTRGQVAQMLGVSLSTLDRATTEAK